MNDATVRIRVRLVIFGSTALLYTDYRTDWKGREERGERRGVPPL